MSLIRDLWDDPDPLKWMIFGGAGLSVILGGLLYWQVGTLNEMSASLSKATRPAPGPTVDAPADSLQNLADKAHNLGKMNQQIEGDKLYDQLDNPTEYLHSNAGHVNLGDVKFTPSANAPSGSTYSDTIYSATPKRDKPVTRDQMYKFLWNCERSPLMTATGVSLVPFDTKHKAGATLADDFWYFDCKLTIRRKKAEEKK